MTVSFGGITFDRVRYDRRGDVLYLHVGDPASAVEFDGSPEGHALRYDEAENLVGVTLLNARWSLERDGEVIVTLPHQRLRLGPGELAPALASAPA